jgi:hypothetical protein
VKDKVERLGFGRRRGPPQKDSTSLCELKIKQLYRLPPPTNGDKRKHAKVVL